MLYLYPGSKFTITTTPGVIRIQEEKRYILDVRAECALEQDLELTKKKEMEENMLQDRYVNSIAMTVENMFYEKLMM